MFVTSLFALGLICIVLGLFFGTLALKKKPMVWPEPIKVPPTPKQSSPISSNLYDDFSKPLIDPLTFASHPLGKPGANEWTTTTTTVEIGGEAGPNSVMVKIPDGKNLADMTINEITDLANLAKESVKASKAPAKVAKKQTKKKVSKKTPIKKVLKKKVVK